MLFVNLEIFKNIIKLILKLAAGDAGSLDLRQLHRQ